ncbi:MULTISPECIES: DUF7093 family protein [Haloferacaceae]|uniref:Oxidoreductase n=1 Tax=Halorubrum glutamatedens TaxID=2707018 RepID=A0ABD5QQV1_9EURY|nr:hypothetical protein [Halobellus captivus]
MGLRCLLGHDFSEPEIEREREEDGKEVVTTVREVKTCARCGETQVVSENTEVTTMKQLTDQATGGEASSSGPTGPPERTEPTGSADGPDGAGTPAESSPDAGEADRGPDIDYGGATAGVDVGGPDGDDAEILDGTSSATDAGSGDAPPAGSDRIDAPVDADRGVAADDEGAELIDEGPYGDAADGSADDSRTPSAPSDPSDTDDASDTVGADDAPDGVDASADSPGDSGDSGDFDVDRDHAAKGAQNDDGAADDDGVILDDEDDAGAVDDRDRGEWPEVEADDDDATFEATPWPEQQGEDEGFDAEFGDDGDSGVEFGGLTPEAAEPATESADAEYVEPAGRTSTSGSAGIALGNESDDAADGPSEGSGALGDGSAGPGSGITREEDPALETEGSRKTPTEYYCPECGMTLESDGSSMRAGDICPECKRGYVAERPR